MKILIAEDDFSSRKLIQRILEPTGQCDVAINGREAMVAFTEALKQGARYDLICLDVMMPQMSGMDVLKAIREEEARLGIGGLDGVKIIMTTCLQGSEDVLGAFREGCEAYLVKPIDRAQLLNKIKELQTPR